MCERNIPHPDHPTTAPNSSVYYLYDFVFYIIDGKKREREKKNAQSEGERVMKKNKIKQQKYIHYNPQTQIAPETP